MAKMSELDAALHVLLEYSEGIQETVRGIRVLMSGDTSADANEAVQASKKESLAERTKAAKPVAPEKTYTLQEVRALLKAKTDQGYRSDVKALLREHGAERLPDIDPKEYPAMMREAEEIGV